jgi:hypothetical protein
MMACGGILSEPMRSFAIVALATLSVMLLACGGRAAPRPSSSGRAAVADSDIRSLVLHAASTGILCSKLRDKFVALPSSDGSVGADAGLTPAAGRWWIRSCEATQVGQALHLKLAGPGWFWVDQSSSGFRVQQHLYFAASVAMTGSLDMAYDPEVKLASVWFTPGSAAQVRVDPIGPINARAESFWAGVFDAITMGVVVSSEARAAVCAQGTQRFQDKLSAGITVTYDVERQQADVVIGQLPRGKVPRRPFVDTLPWWVNERQSLYPNGVAVVGPFVAAPAIVDIAIEQGPGASFRAVCALDLKRALESSATGSFAQLAPASVFRAGAVTRPRQSALLPAVPCPWYLMLSTVGAASAVTAVRVRPLGPEPAVVSPQGAVVRFMLISYRIAPERPDGSAWDVVGGDPDPVVWLRHGKVRYVLSAKVSDVLQATVSASAREPIEVTAGEPIVLEVKDSDLVDDDPIGKVEITLEDLKRGPEFTKALQLGTATTGEVRVRVDVLTWE